MAVTVEKKLTSRARWIFSPALDGLLFLGPAILVIIGRLCAGAKVDVGLGSFTGFLVAVKLLSDPGHIFGTPFKTYFNPGEFKRRWLFYLIFPLVYLPFSYFFFSLSPLWFWRLLAYAVLFHVVRQQYGWMMLANASGTTKMTTAVDGFAIYSVAVISLLITFANLNPSMGHFVPGDLIHLPSDWAPVLGQVFWFVFLGYVGLLFGCGGRESLPKVIIFVSTAIVMRFAYLRGDNVAVMSGMALMHGLPYLVAVHASETRSGSQGLNWRSVLFREKRLWLFFGLIFVVAWLYFPFMLANRENINPPPHPWPPLSFPNLSHPSLCLLNAFISFFAVLHLITDSFLWRRRLSPLAASLWPLPAARQSPS